MILFRSPRRVFLTILGLGLFFMAANNISDPDFWWHLKTGQLIVETRHIPRTDPYSFTRSGQPWIDHEWLSQILIYGTYCLAGWSGEIVLFALIILATQLLVYARGHAKPYAAGAITLWSAFAAAPAWGARPQMISLLLGAVFLVLLEQRGRRNMLWWTVPLMVIWVNVHAGYALGIAFLGLYLLGAVLDGALGVESWAKTVSRLRAIGGPLCGCLLVVPLNPNGIRMYGYPLATLASPAMQQNIVEWASPNFHNPIYLPLLFMLLAILAALALSARHPRPSQLLLLVVTAAGALQSIRHIPIFCLVGAPFLSELVNEWRQTSSQPKLRPEAPPAFGKRAFNTMLVLAFAAVVLFRVISICRAQPQVEAQRYPVAAAAFLARHAPQAPMLNAYDWGGYFIWRLYPPVRVFIDGRADVYGDHFLEDYRKAFGVDRDWKAALDDWHVRTVVVPPAAPLASALLLAGGWTPIYRDNQSVVLERAVGGPSAHPIERQDIPLNYGCELSEFSLLRAFPRAFLSPKRARNCNQTGKPRYDG